jgi:large subunit ribosomal protein L29
MSEAKYIKAQKLRDLSVAELQHRIRELKSQQYTNRVDRTTGRLENFRLIPQARRRLAAVLTILKEKELAAASGQGGK